jgi:hypothetical protein
VTTSSDRLLLRWIPLAALLAVAMAVGLSVGPNPFGFHGWPKAPAPRSVPSVVRVVPRDAPIAIARRDEGDSPARPARDAVAAERSAPARHRERVSHAPRHGSTGGTRHSHASPGRVESPAPPAPDQGSDSSDRTPDGSPVAQAPSPLPEGAEAKPQVPQVTQPDPMTQPEPGFEGEHGPGNGHAYGHRHGHGHRGWD